MEGTLATRLKLFMDTSGLTSSQFADMCGIPRPSLSQILSGRNKKVSDLLIGQIHRAFPDLSITWLLFGEGKVRVSANESSASDSSTINTDSTLFSGNSDSDPENFVRNASLSGVSYADGVGNSNLGEIFKNSGSEISGIRSVSQPGKEYFTLGGLKRGEISHNSSKNESFETEMKIMDLQRQIENLRKNPRRVVQITIYYDDSTFETFVPKG